MREPPSIARTPRQRRELLVPAREAPERTRKAPEREGRLPWLHRTDPWSDGMHPWLQRTQPWRRQRRSLPSRMSSHGELVDVIVQDEFTHDVVVRAAVVNVCFDTT